MNEEEIKKFRRFWKLVKLTKKYRNCFRRAKFRFNEKTQRVEYVDPDLKRTGEFTRQDFRFMFDKWRGGMRCGLERDSQRDYDLFYISVIIRHYMMMALDD